MFKILEIANFETQQSHLAKIPILLPYNGKDKGLLEAQSVRRKQCLRDVVENYH
jgi:hypothetical protein